ncbi:transducin-like G-protein beta [Theileria orientalis]|uniref:Transducin-like G-protein beta n=1 Tax=Theileria orientalis TaxID=68886 RepID=A0A976MEK6_THEOR|nr:transducin-like G-protein beta [Theileria orientalis]
MDSDGNYLVSFYKETSRYFSYGGDNLIVLPNLNSFISQYNDCLYAVPLQNLNDSSSLVESLLRDELLDDIDPNEQNKRDILCILDSNEDNLYNGTKYSNRCVVALGGISRYIVNPASDQLIVVFSNNVMCVYSLLSDKKDWLYLSLISSIKINNNNKGISSICVNNNDIFIGLMDGTVLVYQKGKFKNSFRINSSPITLLKPFKREKLFLCNREGDVYLYDYVKRVRLAHFKDHTAFVKSLHYIITKENEIGLITLDNDNIIDLWSISGASSTVNHKGSKDKEDDILILGGKEKIVRPFKRSIKHENIVSVIVVTSKLSEHVEGRKKGSWVLLIIEESGKMYYEDPTDQSVILKNQVMYGFGLVKSVEYTKELIVLLSLNGTILLYDHSFKLIKSLMSNFNNLFQFSLINPTVSTRGTRINSQSNNDNENYDIDIDNNDDDHDEELFTENEMDVMGKRQSEVAQSAKELYEEVDRYYEYSKSWYNNHRKRKNGSKLMIVLTGDEVIRILLLNQLNEFIPLGLKNTNQTHKEVVTTIYHDHQNDLLLSGSKDKLIILWDMKRLVQLKLINTIYIVTSLLLVTTKLSNSNIVDIVCSNNNIINLYSTKLSFDDMESKSTQELGDMNKEVDKSTHTSVVHKTNINYLGISHNQKYISSCSNDKVIVVHHANNLIVKGRCVGHKKSVLYVKFMKMTRTLVSSSMDQTIKIWNLSDFTNVKTLQGHTNSIMKILALDNNVQLISCGLDGFVKLWNVPNSDCVQTLNSHDNQSVWDIEMDNNQLYSVSNNLIVVSEDASGEMMKKQVLEDKNEEIVTSQINSLLLKDDYKESLVLSIKLNNIKLTNSIILKLTNKLLFEPEFQIKADGDDGRVVGKDATDSREEDVYDYIISRIKEEKEEEERKQLLRNLLNFIKTWITNRKNYYTANVLLNKILRNLKLEELFKVEGLLETVEFLLHNLSNHQTRLSNLQEKSYLLDIITQHNPVSVNTNIINDVLYKY